MRIKRLHILLGVIGLSCLAVGGYNIWSRHKENQLRAVITHAQRAQVEQVTRAPAADLSQTARQSIATIGEAYRPLNKRFGEIPPIAVPLRAAKHSLTEGKTEQAMASAREAWLALKMFRQKAGTMAPTYQVVRGDTLWRIAMNHSPAKAGEGWVTIWKANKDLVNDFNRLEVGWTLKIPPKENQYVMPFWKPPSLR